MKRETGNNFKRLSLTADQRLLLFGRPQDVFKQYVGDNKGKVLRPHADFLEIVSATQFIRGKDKTIDRVYLELKSFFGNASRARAICDSNGTEEENELAAEWFMSIAYMEADRERE